MQPKFKHLVTPSFLMWFRQLPREIRPFKLLDRHPHVLHHLQSVWPRPWTTHQYFQGLLLSDRQERQGFTPDVLLEIQALFDHYQEAFPGRSAGEDSWVPVHVAPIGNVVASGSCGGSFADPKNSSTWQIEGLAGG